MTVKLTIPRVPKSPNSLLQRHWRVVQNDKNDWKEQVLVACLDTGIPRKRRREPSRVTIAIHSPYQEMDPDNLQASRKPILDALKYNRLIYDDAREWCESTITQHGSTKKDMRTEIAVEDV